MARARETPEERKRRLLMSVEEGAADFMVQTRRRVTLEGDAAVAVVHTPAPAPAPAPPAMADPIETAGIEDAPPEVFRAEPRRRQKSLNSLGWVSATNRYDPETLRAAHELARELGIWFAELQNVALLLVTDPKRRSQETEALLERIRGPR